VFKTEPGFKNTFQQKWFTAVLYPLLVHAVCPVKSGNKDVRSILLSTHVGTEFVEHYIYTTYTSSWRDQAERQLFV
jgi:hypothetical protein